jgi:hypothetical protein
LAFGIKRRNSVSLIKELAALLSILLVVTAAGTGRAYHHVNKKARQSLNGGPGAGGKIASQSMVVSLTRELLTNLIPSFERFEMKSFRVVKSFWPGPGSISRREKPFAGFFYLLPSCSLFTFFPSPHPPTQCASTWTLVNLTATWVSTMSSSPSRLSNFGALNAQWHELKHRPNGNIPTRHDSMTSERKSLITRECIPIELPHRKLRNYCLLSRRTSKFERLKPQNRIAEAGEWAEKLINKMPEPEWNAEKAI